MRKSFLVLSFMLAFFYISAAEAATVQEGMQVTFSYTLRVDGEVIESSENTDPIKYIHGRKNILSGLAEELDGLKAGDKKTVIVPPEKGYGNVVEEVFKKFSRNYFPEDFKPQIGMMVELQRPDGSSVPGKITLISDESIVIDFNHPFAGKTLEFDVEILDVQESKEEVKKPGSDQEAS